MKEYDYLIVGAGLAGSLCAYFLTQKGKTCLIIDRRSHIGGNIFTSKTEGIQVHRYGAHIFHTKDKYIWEFIQRFSEFNHYINSPLVKSKGELYNLPFNMNTYYKLWGVMTPIEVREIIDDQRSPYMHIHPKNLKEQALQLVGNDIYEVLIKEYTEKQWGKKSEDLPPDIIKRIPIRFTYDNNYFDDYYQGIPVNGYTNIINQLIENSEVRLNTDYNQSKYELSAKVKCTIYTGCIDEYFDYCYGRLEYRSLKFEHELIDCENYQGNAVINYADKDIPYTRVIEHKHFLFGNQPYTVISREYPVLYHSGNEPFYPVNNIINNRILKKYQEKGKTYQNLLFVGRLANYQYYNMDQIIQEVMNLLNYSKI